jgi:NADPH:quinone reductase-like Zn-dependent oxidoreductase
MKAAVLNKLGSAPVYSDFPEPVPQSEEQVVMQVIAAALKHLDKLKTRKEYYAPYQEVPVVTGTDGVGTLPDGTLVYAQGITGTMAEKTLITAGKYTVLPAHLDMATAAALPNAVLGSAVPLIVRAQMKPGEVVLINGATGITGRVAVQVAKYYGASKVIAVGRNEDTLGQLQSLGADMTVSLNQNDRKLLQLFKETDRQYHIDVIIDYLWGSPAEHILRALENRETQKMIRFVTVGDMAGNRLSLSSGTLRSADIMLLGSGFGSLFPEVLRHFNTEMLPEMFALATANKLKIETETRHLSQIDTVWNTDTFSKRIVLLPD